MVPTMAHREPNSPASPMPPCRAHIYLGRLLRRHSSFPQRTDEENSITIDHERPKQSVPTFETQSQKRQQHQDGPSRQTSDLGDTRPWYGPASVLIVIPHKTLTLPQQQGSLAPAVRSSSEWLPEVSRFPSISIRSLARGRSCCDCPVG